MWVLTRVISALDLQGPDEHIRLVFFDARHDLFETVSITCQCCTVWAVIAANDDAGAKIRCDLSAAKTDGSHSTSPNLPKT